MAYLVGELVLSGGEKVKITFSDKRTLEAVYYNTYGYNHIFKYDSNKEIKLSNHFMKLKDITIEQINDQ